MVEVLQLSYQIYSLEDLLFARALYTLQQLSNVTRCRKLSSFDVSSSFRCCFFSCCSSDCFSFALCRESEWTWRQSWVAEGKEDKKKSETRDCLIAFLSSFFSRNCWHNVDALEDFQFASPASEDAPSSTRVEFLIENAIIWYFIVVSQILIMTIPRWQMLDFHLNLFFGFKRLRRVKLKCCQTKRSSERDHSFTIKLSTFCTVLSRLHDTRQRENRYLNLSLSPIIKSDIILWTVNKIAIITSRLPLCGPVCYGMLSPVFLVLLPYMSCLRKLRSGKSTFNEALMSRTCAGAIVYWS